MAVVYGSTLNTPVLWINNYLQEKLALDVGIGVPMFPTMPASLDDLTERFVVLDPATLPSSSQTRYAYAGVMATWDRLFRRRPKGFPHVKTEQIMYYFYATAENVTENMVRTQEEVYRLLDREDETAEEINRWARIKTDASGGISINSNDTVPAEFFFHGFKVYQLEEIRDIIDFGTARTYGGNKIIIEYSYHQMSPRTWQLLDPEGEVIDSEIVPSGPLDNTP